MTTVPSRRSREMLFAGAAVGAFVAIALTPTWVTAIAGSLEGSAPKAFWYLSRASGLTAYGLIWVSMVSGLLQSNRLVCGAAVMQLHRHAAWTGLAFAAFHALVLFGDSHVGGDAMALVVPFGMTRHASGWVGLGQLSLYGSLALALSFRLRSRIGGRTWRLLHYASFTVFVLVLVHGVQAGTDARLPWVVAYYAATASVVASLTALRILRRP